MKDKKRGRRRAKTRTKIGKRYRELDMLNLGLGAPARADVFPGKLDKTKAKFTSAHGSLKSDKKIANKQSRRKRHQAAKKGEEEAPEGKNSVKWNYW